MAVLFDLLIVSRASSSSVMSSSSSVSSLETTVSFPSVTATASSISVSWPAVGQQIDALLSLPPERLKQLLLIAMDRLQTDDPDSSHPSSSSVLTSALLTGGVVPTAHSGEFSIVSYRRRYTSVASGLLALRALIGVYTWVDQRQLAL